MEAYNLPIRIRMWFLERLSQEIQKEADAVKDAQSKNHSPHRSRF